MELQYEKDSKERIPYEHYMELFQKADPAEISARTGIPYDKQSQTFNLHLLGVAYQVHFPDYVVTHDPESKVGYYPLEAAINARILVLRYLVEGHSAPSAMEKIGATPLEHGDIAYEFEVIDGFRVQMILWAGDDEFPPSSQILFSDNFPIAFQAEDMAVVGDISITMIKALA